MDFRPDCQFSYQEKNSMYVIKHYYYCITGKYSDHFLMQSDITSTENYRL